MNNRELKRKLRAESTNFVPDIKNELFEKLNLQTKEKPKIFFSLKKLSLAFSVLILTIVSLFIINAPNSQHAILLIDINPSFEIEVKNEKVISVQPLNLDAAFVIEEAGTMNKNLDKTLQVIIEKAYELGYLDSEQTINLLTVSTKQKTEEKINQKIKNKMQSILQKNSWNFRINNKNENNEIVERAKKHRVSKGLMLLIDRAMAKDVTLNLETALTLSPKELNEIIKDYRDHELETFQREYRKNQQIIKEKIENTLKVKEEKIKQIKEQLEAYQKALNENKHNPLLKLEIATYLQGTFPGYNFTSAPGNQKGRIEELLAEINSLENFINEATAEIIQVQSELFTKEIKRKLRNKEFNFEFEFQKDLNFDQLLKKYRRGLSGREIRIYSLAEQIYNLINKNDDRLNIIIESLYRQYQKHLERTDEDFQNSDYIRDFEAFYKNYQK